MDRQVPGTSMTPFLLPPSPGQFPDLRDVTPVVPPAIDRCLADKGPVPEKAVMEHEGESLLANRAETDVLVAVEARPLLTAGVVEVDEADEGKPDDLVEPGERLLDPLRGAQLVACSERVAGVETDSGFRGVLYPVEDGPDVLERASHAVLFPGGVLEEEEDAGGSNREGPVHRVDHPLSPGIRPVPEVVAEVRDEEGDGELPAPFELGCEGGD